MTDRRIIPINQVIRDIGIAEVVLRRLRDDHYPLVKKRLPFRFVPFWICAWLFAFREGHWLLTAATIFFGMMLLSAIVDFIFCKNAMRATRSSIKELNEYLNEHYPNNKEW
jgi:hypothetical protein